jgi:hypothetical protein
MPETDILFIHPPRRLQHDWGRWITGGLPFIPLGVLALADLCQKEGYSSRVLNIPLELALNPQWDMFSYLRQNPAQVYAIDLHWFATSYGAISTAQICKRINPQAKILMGGHTASFFADEILQKFPVVDAIIRGEAEQPLLAYLRVLKKGKQTKTTLRQVPNLSYHVEIPSNKSPSVYHNPISFVAKKEDLASLNFVNLSLLEHWSEYLQILEPYIPYCIMVARGCPFNCPFCSGSRISTAQITQRRRVLYREPAAIAQDIATIAEYGLTRRLFLGHGLYTATNQYWNKIFQEVRSFGVDIGADLEVWRLPVKNSTLTAFTRTFDPVNSSLDFSLHAASLAVRKRLAFALRDPHHAHTNSQLQKLIESSRTHNLALRLWISIGSPFQDVSDLFQTLSLHTSLSRKTLAGHYAIQLFIEPITPSPGSPAYLFPERFGVKLHLREFTDYYHLYQNRLNRFFSLDAPLAYETNQLPHSHLKLWTTFASALNVPVFMTNRSRN